LAQAASAIEGGATTGIVALSSPEIASDLHKHPKGGFERRVRLDTLKGVHYI
jgi:hypothetical protein